MYCFCILGGSPSSLLCMCMSSFCSTMLKAILPTLSTFDTLKMKCKGIFLDSILFNWELSPCASIVIHSWLLQHCGQFCIGNCEYSNFAVFHDCFDCSGPPVFPYQFWGQTVNLWKTIKGNCNFGKDYIEAISKFGDCCYHKNIKF